MTDKGDPGSMTTRQLRARRRRLARSLPDVEGLIAGSVVEQGRRGGKEGCRWATGQAHGAYTYVGLPRAGGRGCGKCGCRCATGQAHGPYTYVVRPRSGGRTRTVYVPASAAEAVRRGGAPSTRGGAGGRRPRPRCGRRWRRSRPSISSCWPGGSWPEWPWWPRLWRCWPTWRPRRWRREVRGAEKITSGHRERSALIYVRQSSLAPGRENTGSTG